MLAARHDDDDITLPKLWKVPSMFGSIMVVCGVIHCALLLNAWDLKAAKGKCEGSYALRVRRVEATKNICHAKDESAVNHSRVT